MDDEDDRYWPPTHTCNFCNRCFSASWDHSDSGKRLIVDLLSGGEAITAAKLGCCFYQEVLFPYWPTSQDAPVTLAIERTKRLSVWEDIGPYLNAQKPSACDEFRFSPSLWEENLGLKVEPVMFSNKFLVYVAGGHTTGDPWFDAIVPPPNLNPTSKQTTTQIRTWLNYCALENERLPGQTTTLLKPNIPRRVLKIDPERDFVYLVEPMDAYKYALLSYCWGGDQSTKTTKLTLTSHRRGININTLPNTIQDAIRVTRTIGLEYIWIDALCIVQDDKNEVTQEIAKQAAIYQNGFVTILAGGAVSADEGFLYHRSSSNPRYSISIRVPDGKEVHVLVDVRCDHEIFAKIEDITDPVNRRAWIFQEVLLSPNLLYFSPKHLMFFYGRSVHTDGGVPTQLYSHRNSIRDLRSKSRSMSMNNKASVEYDTWHQLVRTYSRLQLSDSADKLLAISAIAEALGVAMLGYNSAMENYKAGLWQQHMPLNLLWFNAQHDPCSRPPYRAPSWSWASIDRGILTFSHRYINSYHPDCYTAAVLDVGVSLASSIAPYGQVLGGKLKVDGLVRDIPSFRIEHDTITLQDPDFEFEEHCLLDAIEPSRTSRCSNGTEYLISILCLIRLPRSQEEIDYQQQKMDADGKHRHSMSSEMFGLVLRRMADEVYHTRIGMLRLIKDDPLSDLSLQRWQGSFARRTITIF